MEVIKNILLTALRLCLAAQAYTNAGYALEKMGRNVDALAWYRNAMDRFKQRPTEHAKAQQRYAMLSRNVAYKLFEEGRLITRNTLNKFLM